MNRYLTAPAISMATYRLQYLPEKSICILPKSMDALHFLYVVPILGVQLRFITQI